MNTIVEHRWALPEVDTVFELVFAMERGAAPDGHRVAVTCRWPPAETRTLTLSAARATPISLDFLSGYRLRGTMTVIHDNDRRAPSIGVNADLTYDWRGQPPVQHFQGLVFLSREPIPPPPPPPDPPTPVPPPMDDDEDDDPVAIITPHDELFPYLYVRQWPKIPAEDLHDRFFSYDDTSPPGASFLVALAALVPQGRPAMEALALAFIDGAMPWQRQYIASRSALRGPIAEFAPLALRLQQADRAGWVDTLCHALQALLERYGKTGAWLRGPDYAAALDRVWQSYFALTVLLGYDQALLADLALTLWLANAVAKALSIDADGRLHVGTLTKAQNAAVAHASLLLPATVFPLPAGGGSSPPASGHRGWIEPYAVGDLQMVRQRLLRYVPGEIARIENVMRGERREVSSRQGRQRLDIDQKSGEELALLESDDSDARTSLLQETSRLVAGKTIGDSYENFTTSYGPPTQATLNGTLNRVTTAGSPASDDVTRFAREIVGKAVNRIARKVGTVRATSSLSHVEDAVVSVIDNSGGGNSLSAVYRWVNKVYEACVVNYGNRLIMEFVVRRPAAVLHDPATTDRHHGGAPFPPPAHLGIGSFEDVGPRNYARLCATYGVTEIVPPPGPRSAAASVRTGDETQIAIPPGYTPSSAAAGCATAAGPPPAIMVGCLAVVANGAAVALPPLGEAAAIPVAVAAPQAGLSPPEAGECIVNIEIACVPTPRCTDEWRIQIYSAIVRAYAQGIERRLAAVADGTAPAVQRSPLAAARIARDALKHGCLDLLLERAAVLTDWGRSAPSASPPVDVVNWPRCHQFLDQALEWPEMSYSVHHDRPGGAGREDAGHDPAFASFLHADRARALVPVRPDHVLAFLYFFASGMIWDGPDRLVAVNAVDLHIVDDIKRAAHRQDRERTVGKPWEVVVPTAMQVLDGSGLPSFAVAPTPATPATPGGEA